MKKTDKKQHEKGERHFGILLREHLDRNGIKYAWFAEKIGVTQMRLQRIFAGYELTLQEGQAIARQLKIGIDQLKSLDELIEKAA